MFVLEEWYYDVSELDYSSVKPCIEHSFLAKLRQPATEVGHF